MNALNQLLSTLNVEANVFHNGQYCGAWSVDLSGQQNMVFHLVSKGSCYARTAETTYELNTGDAVFFPGDMKHVITNEPDNTIEPNVSSSLAMSETIDSSSTGLVCGNFGLGHPVFKRIMQQLPDIMIVRKEEADASSRVLALMLDESKASDQNSSVLLNRLSDCLFFLLVRDHLNTDTGVFAAIAHPKLAPAMELIHGISETKLSVEQLAEACAMSRSSFAALFKEVVEQSPADYILQWRMSLAYRFLSEEGMSTLGAALKVGYESEASFAKAFSRVMGFGPGQARSNKY